MTDLTEQWKKGELPSGWYYTKLWKGCNVIDFFIGNQFLRYDDSDIVEVIAEVPDYVEWQNMVNCACEEHEANKRFIEENAQLKELLKECKSYVNSRLMKTRERLNKPYTATDKVLHKKAEKLLTKIDEALR